jgi:hypothetical protein
MSIINYIKGENFEKICDYVLDVKGFKKNDIKNDIPKFFVKTDLIKQFFNEYAPNKKFILITHNSDLSVDSKYKHYLEKNSNLIKWYAQNVDYKHEKLIPIPIGIANKQWPHGNISILNHIIYKNYDKEKLLYANFNTKTNPKARNYCLKFIDTKFVENNVSFELYLKNLAKSCFSICPIGNGIDSHRIWESLYLKTVPIAENTYNIRYLKEKYNLPMILINDWSELPNLKLDNSAYINLIQNYKISILNISRFL